MERPGRNDPCPCGSGAKYKRCCLGKEDARMSYVASLRERTLPLLARLARYAETQAGAPLHVVARNAFPFWAPPLTRAQAARVVDFLMFDFGPRAHRRRTVDEFLVAQGDVLERADRETIHAWSACAMRPYVVAAWSGGVIGARDLLDEHAPPVDVFALQGEAPLAAGEVVGMRPLPFGGGYFTIGEPLRLAGQPAADVSAQVHARHADFVRADRIVPLDEFLRLAPVLDELAAGPRGSGLIILPGSA